MNEATQPTVLKGGEVSDLISRLVIWGVLAAFALSLFGLVQALRHEFTWRYTLFLAGGLLSILVLFGLPLHAVAVAFGKARKPSWLGMIITFSGFIPYLLGLYLVVYEGFWRLGQLRHGFSVMVVFTAVVYVALGSVIVKSIDGAISFHRDVDEGQLVLT